MTTGTLHFGFLDDLALAVQLGRASGGGLLSTVAAERVGPLLELLILERGSAGKGFAVASLKKCAMVEQLQSTFVKGADGMTLSNGAHRLGFITTKRDPAAQEQIQWTKFCFEAQRAAEYSGLPKQQARALVGALREIEENIHLHSQRASDGIVGYRATTEQFEFVVADSGIGALAGFRQSPHYANLVDAGTAIRLVLTDGESRLKHQDPGRGYGFHGLFVGLANLNGQLRFRSDDHVLTIDGSSPSLLATRLSQTARIQGFVASVACRAETSTQMH